MKLPVALVLTVLVVAGCGGSGGSDEAAPPKATATATTTAAPTPAPEAELEAAVRNYSKAFLTGDGATAYGLLSKACQDTIALSDFAAITEQAKDQYGDVAISSLDVKVSGDKATATYTYPVATLNQTDEAWVNEDGWKNNDC